MGVGSARLFTILSGNKSVRIDGEGGVVVGKQIQQAYSTTSR